MRAMVLEQPGAPLVGRELPDPVPGTGELLIEVVTCGVCRTDLHILDGELTEPRLPLVPGHQIVGRVVGRGPETDDFADGELVGVPWLGWTCGECRQCLAGRENLCERARFTGYDVDGGYAELAVANARFCFSIPDGYAPLAAAPLLCAGLIGYRALGLCGDAERIALYGFGASAHIVCQVAVHQGREVVALTKPGDAEGQRFALALGASWAGDVAGGSEVAEPGAVRAAAEAPAGRRRDTRSAGTAPGAGGDLAGATGAPRAIPGDGVDAAIVFAPAGELVPAALRELRPGGTVVCAGIHMSDIPSFPYADLWEERSIRSVANLTRRDGDELLALAPRIPIRTEVAEYPLERADDALADLRAGRIARGGGVLRIRPD